MSKPFYTIEEFISHLIENGIEASVSKVIDWCIEEKLFLSVPINILEFANEKRIGIYHTERSYVVNEPGEPFKLTSESNLDTEFPLFYSDIKSKLIEPPFPKLEKNNFDIEYFAYVPYWHLEAHDDFNTEAYWNFADSFSLIPTPFSERKEKDKRLLYCLSPDRHGTYYWPTQFTLHSNRLPKPVFHSTLGLQLQLFITKKQASRFLVNQLNCEMELEDKRINLLKNKLIKFVNDSHKTLKPVLVQEIAGIIFDDIKQYEPNFNEFKISGQKQDFLDFINSLNIGIDLPKLGTFEKYLKGRVYHLDLKSICAFKDANRPAIWKMIYKS